MVEELKMNIPLEKQMEILSEVASPLVVLAELIKNSYDEKAKNISICIDTKNKIIEVTDDGRGFTESTIKTLSKPGESYKKKDNLYNPHGKFFAGSMGIGLLSVFSIAQELEIKTKGSEGAFVISGNNLALSYSRVDDSTIDNGTKLILKEVNDSDLRVLIEDIKHDKLKHVSIKNYLEDYKLFDLEVNIDGITQNIDSPNAEELYKMPLCNFVSKVDFSYSKSERKLTYQIERTDSQIINTDPVAISFNEEVSISNILEKHYNITTVTHEKEFIFLPHGASQVCDFEGTFYIKEGNKGAKEINKFGAAVRLYVNGFAMYNYLDRQNDWLQLAYLTQNVKNSALKPKNTIGYIAFNQFNEYDEELQISKERSHFYDKSPYRAFYEMIYNIVVLLTFNIDVAARKEISWKSYFDEDFLKWFNNKDKEIAATNEEADQKKENDSVIEPENKGDETKEEEKKKEKELEKEPETETGKKLEKETKPQNLLRFNKKTLEQGQQLYLRDPDILIDKDANIVSASLAIIDNDIFSEKNNVGSYSINYYKDQIKETLTIRVKQRKVIFDGISDTRFFGHSNCFIGEIDLSEIGELVEQLYDLDYEKHYLLFVISFRAILEDMVKKYNYKRQLGLSGIFKDNLLLMIDDLKGIIKASKNDPLKQQKQNVHVKFKGYDNLNNFLISVETRFRNENYDKFLHSLTHNPTRIEYTFAKEIANELILPLHVLIKCLSRENII